LAKKFFKNADTTKLSAVPPDPYGNRFTKFMKDVFELDTRSVRKDQDEDFNLLKIEIES
jgi:hypothetical protein